MRRLSSLRGIPSPTLPCMLCGLKRSCVDFLGRKIIMFLLLHSRPIPKTVVSHVRPKTVSKVYRHQHWHSHYFACSACGLKITCWFLGRKNHPVILLCSQPRPQNCKSCAAYDSILLTCCLTAYTVCEAWQWARALNRKSAHRNQLWYTHRSLSNSTLVMMPVQLSTAFWVNYYWLITTVLVVLLITTVLVVAILQVSIVHH